MNTALAVAFGAFLLISGVAHFALPGYFVKLVPPWLPRPRLLVHTSGVLEILLGVGLLLPRTRPLSAIAATALMGVYVLAHVDAARRAAPDRPRWLDRPGGALVRVVVNLAYVGWAAAIAVTSSS